MKRMPLLSAVAWMAMTVTALAGTCHVVPAGTEGNVPAAPYETWETAANDLRDALAVAQMGDEILVRPGVYAVTEQIAVTAKNLSIRSCDPVTGAPDRDGTVFDGSGLSGEAAGMFTVAAGVAGVTLDGLTLRNSPVGGLSCPSAPRTRVLNCAFTGNTTSGASGGGAYISGNGAVVSNCLFEANRAARISGRGGNGGGLYMPGNEQTRGYVVDCVFRGNEAEASGGHVAATKAVTLVLHVHRHGRQQLWRRPHVCGGIRPGRLELHVYRPYRRERRACTSRIPERGSSGGLFVHQHARWFRDGQRMPDPARRTF